MKKMPDRLKKSPDQLETKVIKVPLSTRLRLQSRETLEKAATKAGTTLSDLTAAILEDYSQWLKTGNGKKTRR